MKSNVIIWDRREALKPAFKRIEKYFGFIMDVLHEHSKIDPKLKRLTSTRVELY